MTHTQHTKDTAALSIQSYLGVGLSSMSPFLDSDREAWFESGLPACEGLDPALLVVVLAYRQGVDDGSQQQDNDHHQSAAQATSPVDVKHQGAGVVQTLLLVVLSFHNL